MEKDCNACFKNLPLDEFYNSKKGSYGKGYKCKSCTKKYAKDNKQRIQEYQQNYRENNKKSAKKYNKMYNLKYKDRLNKEASLRYFKDREKYLELNRFYYHSNLEENRLVRRMYYENNKEATKERIKLWKNNNKDRLSTYYNRRKFKKMELPSTFTPKQWKEAKEHFNNGCAYCGSGESLEQDHFVPLNEGGEYTVDNIIPACRYCNARKHAKYFHDWYVNDKAYSSEREKKILTYLRYCESNTQQLTLI